MAVLTLRPDAAGTYQNWSTFGSPPSHWEGTSDESDSTGVGINDTTSKESENLAGSSNYAGGINSVTAYMRAKAYSGSGDETARILWRTHSTDYESADKSISTSAFTNHSDARTTNPNTGSAWTWSEVVDLEIGARATAVAATEAVQVAEFWIEVDYTPPVKQVSDTGSGGDALTVKLSHSLSDSGAGSEELSMAVINELEDAGTGTEELSVNAVESVSDEGSLAGEKLNVYKMTPPPAESMEDALGSATRMVEVVRVGTVGFKKEYPSKQIIRLRDMTGFYSDEPVRNMIDLYNRLKGKRLAGVNVEIWDQISGAYLGAYNTDKNGTLVLPTDRKFVEALQWKLAGGGYSDCFNGEPGAGTPGLYFYFPCNEGKGTSISSFPGVSGQKVDFSDMSPRWEWYESGFFDRPALKVKGPDPEALEIMGAPPVGYRSFQFLWYCSDATSRTIWKYSVDSSGDSDFKLETYNDGSKVILRGTLAGGTPVDGTTELQAEKWYLIQIETRMWGGYVMETAGEKFRLEMEVYIGNTTTNELSLQDYVVVADAKDSPLLTLCGVDSDGFDEIRHITRELYSQEIGQYGVFIKLARVDGKSKGLIGEPGW